MADTAAADSSGSWSRLADRPAARRALAFYRRHERIAPAVFFFAGVGWDALTVFRIDNPIDTVLVLVYLAALGFVVSVSALDGAGRLRSERLLQWREWFPAAMQFLLGALFSVFVFFYSQSASWTETSVYLGLLIGLLILNEFLHRRLLNLYLGFALYYLALASFLVYFVPVVTGRLGFMPFVAGAGVALAVCLALLQGLRTRRVFASRMQAMGVAAVLAGLFAFHLAAWRLNWIPPVPVALRDAGIYREVVREGDEYRMRFARPPWWAVWRRDDRDVAWRAGDPVYCFTAVFAPTRLESRIVHVWEFRDEATGAWLESDRIGFRIRGGRDYGYRGYSIKRLVQPGRWRVRVETEDGRLLSRIPFTLTETDEPVTRFEWVTAR